MNDNSAGFLIETVTTLLSLSLLAIVPLLCGCGDSPPTQSPSADWVAVAPDVEAHDYRGAAFISANTAWLVGVDGVVVHTTDAGRTWTSQSSATTRTLLDVDFADSRYGLAVGDEGTIRLTADGGRTWLPPLIPPTDRTIVTVDAVTSRKAFILARDAVCYVTVNAGLRWDTVAVAPAGPWHDIVITDTVAFAVDGHGLVSRFSHYDRIIERLAIDTISRNPLVTDTFYHTIDTVWSQSESMPQVVDVALLAVAAGDDGVLCAVGQEGTIIVSTDSGQSWGQVPSGTAATLTDVSLNGSMGLIVGLGGVKLVSTNRGIDWTGIPGDLRLDLFSSAVSDDASLWAFGRFSLLHSADGGLAWERLTSNSALTAPLTDIQFLDDTIGFAVGFNGTIVRTTDGGTVWRLLHQGSISDPGIWLSAVDFVDPLHGWAAGRTGYPPYSLIIMRTTDGGETWETRTFPALPWAEDISFLDIMTGYTCGLGAILKTIDGGDSWEVQPIPIPAALSALEFADSRSGIAVGDGGAVLRTDDGAVWENRSADTLIVALNGISFVNPLLAYAVGSLGAVWKTTDGGSTWEELPSPTDQDLLAVHFCDAANGAAVGAAGTIISTADGGKTWHLQSSPTSLPLLGIFLNAPNSGWIVGEQGTLLRRSTGTP